MVTSSCHSKATKLSTFCTSVPYYSQKLKDMARSQPDGLDTAVIRKGAILGALSLYLDFINLFLMFLRICGGSRD